MKFLGSDNQYRSLEAHLEYLEYCAKLWEGGAYGSRNYEQAERNRQKIKELRERFSK